VMNKVSINNFRQTFILQESKKEEAHQELLSLCKEQKEIK